MSKQEPSEELSEEEIDILKKAYSRRPVAGVVIDTIIDFEKTLHVPEEEGPEAEEEVITAENLYSEPRTYGEYLRYFKSQEAEKMAKEEEPVEEKLVPVAEEEEKVEEEPLIPAAEV